MSSKPLSDRARRAAGRSILKLTGWRLEGEAPTASNYVLIAYPHTSNWDLLFLLAMAASAGVRPSWMGKKELFNGLQGRLLKRLGGVPIDRSRAGGVVANAVEKLRNEPSLALVVPPEGTRGRSDLWKSGFYRIAHGANVPVVMSYLDYGKKVGGFGPQWIPTGDVKKDMDHVRDFYAGMTGKFPKKQGPIKLADEAEE
jgi:1-acyl-sn-glycerol-3-phosphate acyltransferase